MKLKSRKLWIAITGNTVALALIFWPEQSEYINAINNIAGSLISILTNMGYLIAQGGVDKEIERNRYANR